MSHWSTEANQGPGVFISQRVREDVCRAVNKKAAGTDTIFPAFSVDRIAHCYGTSAPYTFVFGARTGQNNDASQNTTLPEGVKVSQDSTLYLDTPDTEVAILSGQTIGIEVTNETCDAVEFTQALAAPGFESTITIPSQTGTAACAGKVLQPGDSCEVYVIPSSPVGASTVTELLVDVSFLPVPAQTVNRDAACPAAVVAPEASTTQIPIKVLPFVAGPPTPNWSTRNWLAFGGIHHDIESAAPDMGWAWRYTQTARTSGTQNFIAMGGLGGIVLPFDSFSFNFSNRPRPTEPSIFFGAPLSGFQGNSAVPINDTFFNQFSSQSYGAYSYADQGSTNPNTFRKMQEAGGSAQIIIDASRRVLFAGVESVWQPTPAGPAPMEAVNAGRFTLGTPFRYALGQPFLNSYLVTPYEFPSLGTAREVAMVRSDDRGGDFLVLGEGGNVWVSGINYATSFSTSASNCSMTGKTNRSLIRGLDSATPGTPGYCSGNPSDFLMTRPGGTTWYTSNQPVVPVVENGSVAINWGYGNYSASTYSARNVGVFQQRTAHLMNAIPAVTSAGVPLSNIVRIATVPNTELIGSAGESSCALALDSSGVVWGAGTTYCWGGLGGANPAMQAGFTPLFNFNTYPKAVDLHRVPTGETVPSFYVLREDGSLVHLRTGTSSGYSSVPVLIDRGLTGIKFHRIDCTLGTVNCVGMLSDGRIATFQPVAGVLAPTSTTVTMTFYDAGCAQVGQPLNPAACPTFLDVKLSFERIVAKGSDGLVYASTNSASSLANGHGGRFNNATYTSTAFTNINGTRRLFPLMTTNMGSVTGFQVSNNYTRPTAFLLNGVLKQFSCSGASCRAIYLNYFR